MEQPFVAEKLLEYLGRQCLGKFAATSKEQAEKVKQFKALNPAVAPQYYYSSESSSEGSSFEDSGREDTDSDEVSYSEWESWNW